MTRSIRNFLATHNLLAVSARQQEVAMNNEQALDTTLLVDLNTVINYQALKNPNREELTGKSGSSGISSSSCCRTVNAAVSSACAAVSTARSRSTSAGSNSASANPSSCWASRTASSAAISRAFAWRASSPVRRSRSSAFMWPIRRRRHHAHRREAPTSSRTRPTRMPGNGP